LFTTRLNLSERAMPACGFSHKRRRRLAFRTKVLSTGRSTNEALAVALVSRTYGTCLTQVFENTQICSGTSMEAVLGPDQAHSSTGYYVSGTTTNSNSLRPFMQALLADSYIRGWVAGHLLNEEMGGRGDADENLTPLTTRANGAHKAYESHIKKMLQQCHLIDRDNKSHDWWYGVKYQVTACPQAMVDPDLIDTCVASHLTITYKYIKIKKDGFPHSVKIEEIDIGTEKFLRMLNIAGKPNCTSANAVNERCNPFNTEFSVEIHNKN
jgi:hypothetical protein